MAEKRKWMQEAFARNKGALRRQAKRAGAMTKKDTIQRAWLELQARKGDLRTRRRARAALTARRYAGR